MFPERAVTAPTYWVTSPTPKAPAQAFRQVNRYTPPVKRAETPEDRPLYSPMGPRETLPMASTRSPPPCWR